MKKQKNGRGLWTPDLGNGSYRNPILYADYSDPDIIRTGDDFYMIASSFNCMPGIPVLHSKDLVNWKIASHVCPSLRLPGYDRPQHGKGLWAPTIKFHNGKFYVYVCTPDEGLFMFSTQDPAGKWSEPVHVKKVTGWIDPCAFWDDDGQAYLIHAFAKSRVGICSLLHLCRMSEDGTQILDDGKIVVDVNGKHHVMEGPRLFKREGYYYISAPAGGIEHGYQVTMRSKDLYGPYEEKISIHEGKNGINGPRQGGFVDLKSGESWFIHFQDLDAYGRAVDLEPVKWENGWPLIGVDSDGDGIGEPVETYRKPDVGKTYQAEIPQASDEFDGLSLSPQWQWQANPSGEWYRFGEKKSCARMFAVRLPQGGKTLYDAPNLFLQKFPSPSFEAQTEFSFRPEGPDDRAGIVVFGLKYAYLAVRKESDGCVLSLFSGGEREDSEQREAEIRIPGPKTGTINFRVSVAQGGICTFGYRIGTDSFVDIGRPFKASKGKWIGAKIGIFAIGGGSGGYADFDWFRIG